MAQLTATQLQQALAARLAPAGLDPARQAAFVDAALQVLIEPLSGSSEAKRRIDRDLLDSNVAYAVPDEALELFPSLVQAVLGGFMHGPAAALPELVGVLLRYRRLRVELTADEAAVLSVLRAAKVEKSPPLSPADIAARLASRGLQTHRPLAELLASLKSKQTDKATLVREADGRWAVGNV